MTDLLCKHPAALQADVQQVAELTIQALHQRKPCAGGSTLQLVMDIPACIGWQHCSCVWRCLLLRVSAPAGVCCPSSVLRCSAWHMYPPVTPTIYMGRRRVNNMC
jgi:hypothetical protein